MYYENNEYADVMARKDYAHARRRAFWRNIWHQLKHKCNDLLPTEKALENIHIQGHCNLGVQKVATEQIIGSTGRYRDFDLAFLPRRHETDGRWINIARARYKGIDLPPPILLQVGNSYFVVDGNHRISVARASGQEYIEAFVTTIDSPAVSTKPSCVRLGVKNVESTVFWL